MAVHYLKKDIAYNDKKMFELSKQLRYQVTDDFMPCAIVYRKRYFHSAGRDGRVGRKERMGCGGKSEHAR